MRFYLVALVFTMLGVASSLHAQIGVSLQIDRFSYLLYEPVQVHVTLHNDSGTPVTLKNMPAKPWLTFLITRADHSIVLPDQKTTAQELQLGTKDNLTLKVNLTPLYAMRETGPYQIQAVVNSDGHEFMSAPLEITLVNGLRIWTESHSVGDSQRTYSLYRFAPSTKETDLYIRVEETSKNLVYANTLIGEIVDFEKPDAFFDRNGKLHVLNFIGNNAYAYSLIGVDGSVLSRTLYQSDDGVDPRLASGGDGTVVVVGGRVINDGPKRERISEAQGPIKSASPDGTPLHQPSGSGN